MDGHTIIQALALVGRVARLNPDAGEIGAGMLASLVAEAREVQAAATTPPPAAIDLAAISADIAGLSKDGLTFRRMVRALGDPERRDVFAEHLEKLAAAAGREPSTPDEFRTLISNALHLLGNTQ